MIDSHCHLNFKTLSDNIELIIDNARKNNITSILSINTNPEEFKEHYKLINKFKSLFISYGLHPANVNSNNIIEVEDIVLNCDYKRVIAIGETGLDFFRSQNFKKEQYRVFENHIEASYQTRLPLIIHQRESESEIIDVITNYQKERPLKIVFHCFTGSSKLRNFCLDNEFYISLSGIITFKNAQNIRDVISCVPLSSILIETDSPFLAPMPHRGKNNEPSYVKFIGEFLSDFFQTPLDSFESIIDDNFYELFSKAIRYNEIS